MMNKNFEEIKESYQQTLNRVISRFAERKENFSTVSGEEIKRVYFSEDVKENNEEKILSLPGVFPYTRGVQPTMYRGRFWTMRQYAGFGDAQESNKRYKFLLEKGQTGLSIAFDLPTQMGYDSDHAMSEGEVGKVGVAIDSLADMETLFEGIPLDKVSTSMTINAPATVLLAMYIAVAEKQGVTSEKLRGTIQNDILKEYIARGTYIFPPEASMRLITDIFEYCVTNVPKWNTISISGYHIREAGSTAIQEIAFTIADGIEYVKAALKSGLDIDQFAPRLSFFFNAHNDLFEEIAKFRAARFIWAKIMKERFGAKKEKSMMLRFHTQTAGSTLTAQQADNNIMRVTIQTLAAVLGGTQSLHTNSRDEALALPTEHSVQIALRTQQIVAHESGVTNTIDPLAGSYFIENLTNNTIDEAMKTIDKIDELGGMVSAIEKGFVQREIQNSAYKYQQDIEKKENIIIGVNKFKVDEKVKPELLKVDPIIGKNQRAKLAKVKENRNNNVVEILLSELKETAKSKKNLMPVIVKAVKEYATLGEICGALRQEFGEYEENVIL
ncbi:MAG: methylmalonyl-CoA mutase family protein [Candidatus Cloacimonadota bacterium]|nr:methylmalonyl-CoA mutase family protein [Candidatus Cloacimonadota bacterium]